MQETIFGLSDYTYKTLLGLLKKYGGIQKAVIYGSRAKGTYRPGSDIDISLYTDGSFSRDDLVKLRGDFYDSDMPYIVDVSIFSELENEALREHISRVGKQVL